MSEEEEQVRRAIVNTAVAHFDVLTQSQALNRHIARTTSDAQREAHRLKDQLVKLRVTGQSVARAGRVWARERQVVSDVMVNYQRITALMESPALVAECVSSGMYHEAVMVIEHVLSYASPTDLFFASLGQELWSTLSTSVDTVLLPRLAGPLTVDAAFKIITFAQRLGIPADTLKLVFLNQRSVYLDELRRDADAAGAPYACLLRHLSLYKVHVCEVVLQYSSCFDDADTTTASPSSPSPLTQWACEQSQCFLRDCERLLPAVTNGSELAMVLEQCTTCCAMAATAHVDVRAALSDLTTARIKALFSQHVAAATQAFQASMVTFTLTDGSPSAGHATSAMPRAEGSDAPRSAPLQLTAWLPLAYALNGVLTAFNAVRKCLVAGVEVHCAAEVVAFVRLTAEAVGRDTDLLASMDQSEQSSLQALANAFVNDFYGYLLQCVETLLGATTAAWVRAATHSDVARLARLVQPPRTAPAAAPLTAVVPATTRQLPSAPQGSAADAFAHVRALLPRDKTPEQRARRLALFQQFDKDAGGSLTLKETYNGLVTILHLNQYTTRLRDITQRAFNKAKSMGNKDRGAGDEELVEFLEFRLLLCYLYDYFELSALFEQGDTSGDRLLDEEELVALAPRLRAWGLPLSDPREVFRAIDDNGSGKVTFDEFVTWAVSAKMDQNGDPDVGVPEPVVPANRAPAQAPSTTTLLPLPPVAAAAAAAPAAPAPAPALHNPFAAQPVPGGARQFGALESRTA